MGRAGSDDLTGKTAAVLMGIMVIFPVLWTLRVLSLVYKTKHSIMPSSEQAATDVQ